LVSHLDAFLKYQNESARLWEHQALTRARFVAGDAAVGKAFEREREVILRRPRQQTKLTEEVLTMRRKLLDTHASRDGEFNVKDDVGGLIDFEFIIQYLVLGNAHAHPELVANLGNIALARIAGELGLIDSRRAQAAADGYRTLRRMQHRLRLNGEKTLPKEGEAADARKTITELWLEVFGCAAFMC
jgi:glutamate-ammonia-ligase adenylyltransferase